jgi:ABC-type antimicrobial peptide transport system permease subunit
MKSTPRPRDQARWLIPGAAMLAAVLIGFGARSLWPKAASQPTADAAVPVSAAAVVRTDVAQRQVVSGTLGYQGSFSVVNELPGLLGYDGRPSIIYVRTDLTRTTQVASLLGPQADPVNPGTVEVSQPSAVLTARLAVVSASTKLFLGLGAIVLLVGAIGIANVMIIAVLERRSEIGLRRALGATRRHIALQFVAESVVLSALGGVAGVLSGIAGTAALAAARHWTVLIPGYGIWGGLAGAIAIGALAGLYPAIRAARLSPAEALRIS